MLKKEQPTKKKKAKTNSLAQSNADQIQGDQLLVQGNQTTHEEYCRKEKGFLSLFRMFHLGYENPGRITLIIIIAFFVTVIILAVLFLFAK